ncbi:Na+/H+ antiporter [Actinokineospora auranticolor]|uniref:CPA1 family monovalent cation:H+ antiporter n=1 Tax=Actinokineospora auranticolor TaxID=155976 RepID=A0A2S6GRM9_9PSEU|nr:Na+/H+ antiporter [Actinokineospora auranticolor]PPK67892.1 CPA1 family monovalent cation:H+ antiporter [Actinokineospora auranticolor]
MDLLLLLAGSLAVAALARKFDWPAPLLLVAVGLVVSFIPGIPDFHLDPEFVLLLVLPPLLYSAALDSSYLDIKASIRPIGLLAIGLVLATTAVVGLVAHMVVPGLPLASALVLGAVVAPPDAVAAVAIGRRLGLPRRAMTLLTGESLGNDATALTAFRVAVAAATGVAAFSWWDSALTLLITSVGGIAFGLVLGIVVHAIRLRLGDGILESALGMLVPFGAYLLAEEVHTSGVLAVVVAGLYLGHNAPAAGYSTRLQETAVWQSVDVLLESLVFALIGLQLRNVVSEAKPGWELLVASGIVLVAVILVRFLWVFPAAHLPRWLFPGIRKREPKPNWRHLTVISWAGMRGVVSLAAAAAIPLDMPGRDVVILLTFVVTVGTLLIQGMTLPALIRRLDVRATDGQDRALAEAQVQNSAARAAVDRLDELINDDDVPPHLADRLRALAEHRGNAAWERLGRQETESPAATFRRLRRQMLEAERAVFVQARDRGEIDDEILRRVQRELDLEEAVLARE